MQINLDFQLTVLRANGSGVAGARIRILSPSGDDMTAQLFGTPDMITDASGIWQGRETGSAGDLYMQNATVQVIAQYYDTWSTTVPFITIGISHLTANLTRTSNAGNYTSTLPDGAFMSSMVPIVCQVESNSAFAWEYIQARVNRPDGSSSPIQAPVDKATQLATLDIRNRLNLGVRPFLVKEPDYYREDTDFSTMVDVVLSSITDEGENTIDETFSVYAAASLPPEGEVGLSTYASETGRAWIVPPGPVIAFRGYYRDVMVWLPSEESAQFELTTTYYNGAGEVVDTTTNDLFDSAYVQRIRINTDPADSVIKCILSIRGGSTVITQPLTVLYRD